MLPYDSRKPIACFSISPSGKFLEFVLFDALRRNIIRVDHEAFTFTDAGLTESGGEQDLSRLKQLIKRLQDRNQVSPNALTILVLPSYFTRDASYPDGVNEAELQMLMLSQAESFYLFKKIEPIVGVGTLQERGRLVYSAYPKSTYLQLEQIFIDLKVPLIAVETHAIFLTLNNR